MSGTAVDSTIELDPVTMQKRSVFAPSTWKDDNVGDLDLGSMSPVPVAEQQRWVIAGKRGEVYLLKTPSVGSAPRWPRPTAARPSAGPP